MDLSGLLVPANADTYTQMSNLQAVRATIQQLEKDVSANSLWDDPSHAQSLLQSLNRAKDELQEVDKLTLLLEDIQTAVELAGTEVSMSRANTATCIQS